MPRLEDIEAAIKRERAKAEADRVKEASQSEAMQQFDKAWERVTQCYRQDIAGELGRDVLHSEFYAGWARRFVELGERLVERCWDWRLNELRPESITAHGDEPFSWFHKANPEDRWAFAIELLKLSCEPESRERIAEHLRRVGCDELSELRTVRFDLEQVKAALERLEHEQGPPWSRPEMSVAELARALDAYASEATIRRRLDAGEWERQPDWQDKSKRQGHYRSKDRAEQREVLRRVRAYLAKQEKLIVDTSAT